MIYVGIFVSRSQLIVRYDRTIVLIVLVPGNKSGWYTVNIVTTYNVTIVHV